MCPVNSVFHHLVICLVKVLILSVHCRMFPLDSYIQIVKGDDKTKVRCFLKFIHLLSTRFEFFKTGRCADPTGSMLRQEVIVYCLCLLQTIHLMTDLLFDFTRFRSLSRVTRIWMFEFLNFSLLNLAMVA